MVPRLPEAEQSMILRPEGPGEVRLKVRINRRVKVLSGREYWPVRS
jgi:hypothetical protein